MPPQTDTPRRSRPEKKQDWQVAAHKEGILIPEAVDEHREKGHVIIDVREPHEYEEGHGPEHPAWHTGTQGTQPPRHRRHRRPICDSGGRAALSAQRLQELGNTAFMSIEGGIKGWMRSGLPTETAAGIDKEE